MKINVEVALGDTHFLLSVIVQPNSVGSGVPAGTAAGGTAAGSTGTDFTPTTSNTSGAYPFKIISWAENYDLP
ncbi:MAG TPA: hypothetical protein VHH73_05100 [Verrucomicrobiae bacterium]|nr:hypothetical protein [Verrucomicrobiae bacterium]